MLNGSIVLKFLRFHRSNLKDSGDPHRIANFNFSEKGHPTKNNNTSHHFIKEWKSKIKEAMKNSLITKEQKRQWRY
jgi:hypothetical protein